MLIEDYVAAVDDALTVLAPGTVAEVIELAGLADIVGGYEHVKMANVARFRERLTESRTALGV